MKKEKLEVKPDKKVLASKKTISIKEDNKEQTDMIVGIINRGFADFVVDASRDAGASGATILNGRSSLKVDEKINGITMHDEKEIVLILVKKKLRTKVMKEICERTHLQERGNGVCFSVPVDSVLGISSFDKKAPKKVKTKDSSKNKSA